MLEPHINDSSQSPQAKEPLPSEGSNSTHSLRNKIGSKITWLWLLAIPVFAVMVLGVATMAGYVTGLGQWQDELAFGVLLASQEQFDLGVEEIIAERYEIARQRFEYVISLDPDFPGAVEYLGIALEALNQPTPTAIPIASSTPSVTPDLGSHESMFQSANAAYARGDWSEALNIVILLRGEDPNYRLEEVNQIMSVSLRNRGMDKLFQGRLEEGIYDLSLAERFGALDSQAMSWRRSAEFYMFAISYYGLDWELAVEYIGQMCTANIWLACYKYAQAAREYGHLFLADEDFCRAVIYYEQFFIHTGDNTFAPTATEVSNLCLTATAPTPTTTETLTPTPGTQTSTPTSTSTGTLTDTPTLSVTATATATGAATSTDTLTPTPTETEEETPSGPPTETPTVTSTATPTATPSPTHTPSPTFTPTETG